MHLQQALALDLSAMVIWNDCRLEQGQSAKQSRPGRPPLPPAPLSWASSLTANVQLVHDRHRAGRRTWPPCGASARALASCGTCTRALLVSAPHVRWCGELECNKVVKLSAGTRLPDPMYPWALQQTQSWGSSLAKQPPACCTVLHMPVNRQQCPTECIQQLTLPLYSSVLEVLLSCKHTTPISAKTESSHCHVSGQLCILHQQQALQHQQTKHHLWQGSLGPASALKAVMYGLAASLSYSGISACPACSLQGRP